jgi:hypothetical protein
MRPKHSQSDTTRPKKKARRGTHGVHCRAGAALPDRASRTCASGEIPLFQKTESGRAHDWHPRRFEDPAAQKTLPLSFSTWGEPSQATEGPPCRLAGLTTPTYTAVRVSPLQTVHPSKNAIRQRSQASREAIAPPQVPQGHPIGRATNGSPGVTAGMEVKRLLGGAGAELPRSCDRMTPALDAYPLGFEVFT